MKPENNGIRTSKKTATEASKKLNDKKSAKSVKKIAGSSLVNRKKKA